MYAWGGIHVSSEQMWTPPPCTLTKTPKHPHRHLPRQIWISVCMLSFTLHAALCRRPLSHLLAGVDQMFPTQWRVAAAGWYWIAARQLPSSCIYQTHTQEFCHIAHKLIDKTMRIWNIKHEVSIDRTHMTKQHGCVSASSGKHATWLRFLVQ